jgi:CheY-like chemotaxis protein
MNSPRELLAGEILTVLIVDDVEANLSVLSHMVTRLGHQVVLARGGDEAVELFRERAPDLILMDVWMPSMDGFQTTERIRGLQGTRWVPVIYVTAQDLEGGLVRAIEAGGDDYLTKPIAADLLHAKLRAAGRILALQRENARHQAALERYFKAAEEEQQVASGLMHRLVQMDTISDRALAYRLIPALHLSGDVIAAARTPGESLYVLLADGTGHGLAAALGVMPVVQPFYAMTQKGFSPATIVKEVNRKVREWLPIGRFIATTLIEVDPHEHMVSVWNGGNPPAILLGENGVELKRFVSRHPPIGILPSAELDLSFERFILDGEAQLIACSDGVIEAQDAAGAAFGMERVIEILASAPRASRMSALSGALDAHLGGGKPHDDVSFVLIDCDAGVKQSENAADRTFAGNTRALRNWRFDVELGPDELRQTDVVPMLGATLERMAIPAAHRGNLFVVLSELFNNALDHGILRLDSKVKSESGGMERYLALRDERLTTLSEGWIRVRLRMIERDAQLRLHIELHDSGEGFHWQHRAAPGAPKEPHGRGIALLRKLCERVEYHGSGNEVVAIYRIT